MDATFNQPENPWQLGATGGRIARWVLGFGFFTVHLGIFLVTGFALLVLNLIRAPDHLWSGGPLFRWGMLVGIHFLGAVICWAVTTAMDAARETRAERMVRTPVPFVPPVPLPAAPALPTPEPATPLNADPGPRLRFQPPTSTPAAGLTPEDSRRFEFRNWRGETAYADVRPRPSPPGWTVMKPGMTPPPVPEPEPVASPPEPASAPVVPQIKVPPVEGDERWTWVEAAAEAWLANRAGPATRQSETAEPVPEPDQSASTPPAETGEDHS